MCALQYAILGDHWNWRGGARERHCAEPLVIDHNPSLRDNSWGQLATLAAEVLLSGNGRVAFALYGETMKVCARELVDMPRETLVARLKGRDDLNNPLNAFLAHKAAEPDSENILRISCLHLETFKDEKMARIILESANRIWDENKKDKHA